MNQSTKQFPYRRSEVVKSGGVREDFHVLDHVHFREVVNHLQECFVETLEATANLQSSSGKKSITKRCNVLLCIHWIFSITRHAYTTTKFHESVHVSN
mmetsp:Transcript_26803/g.37407  ORF Transcript_26803/g.37407 Transcript_26803/m.37407 type:complete len:98 (+) Transcript_26803:818-1111(+)